MRKVGRIVLVVILAAVAIRLFMFGMQMMFAESDRGALPMFCTAGLAGFGAIVFARGLRASQAPNGETMNVRRGALLKFLLIAGIPGALCAITWSLLLFEVMPLTDQFYPYISFPFGPPTLIAMTLVRAVSDTQIAKLVITWLVSLAYFWAIAIPAGQLSGLLPARASKITLWGIQVALVSLHLLWGYGFWQILKA
jgi:hypothetical protein